MSNDDFMNPPVAYEITEKDIISEYERSHDKRKVAKIWGLSIKEINNILSNK